MDNLIDLHTHSVLSTHGFSSLTENIDVALQKGLKYYGISEHQDDNLGIGAHQFSFHNLRIVPKEINGMIFLKGCEFNILPDGSIENENIQLKHIDYGIASIHSYKYKDQGLQLNTNAYLNALESDYIKILGHIDDGRYPADYNLIVKKAKDLHKVIEINNTSLKPTTNRINTKENLIKIIDCCKEYNEPIIINSDAHIKYDVGNYIEAYELLKECSFPNELIINFNESLIQEYFLL